MRLALINENADLVAENHRYVMKITGDDAEGKAQLDNFIMPREKYPVIATTSKLLSTGVDAQTVKLIVLDQHIKSMTEFKQIIGRGTRINEDFGKFSFTIMDFKKATELFADPKFDGEPVQVYKPGPDDPPVPPEDGDQGGATEGGGTRGGGTGGGDTGGGGGGGGGSEPRTRYYVGDVKVKVTGERVQYYSGDGKLITESLKDYTRKKVLTDYASLDSFLTRWKDSERKEAILQELKNHGVLLGELAEQVGKDFDTFDLICHVAFDQPPLTRKERAGNVRKRNYFSKYGDKARAVLEALLDKYADVQELDRRGWVGKQWTTRKGTERGGKRFTKTSLYKILTNIVFIGKIRYKTEIHEGEHAGIVDLDVWQRVQGTLGRNGRIGGAVVRNKFGAFLKGLLRCVPCGCAMTPAHTAKGNKRYRYYVCSSAQKRGWHTCPSKSIPAAEIERFVVDQIKCIGKDPTLLVVTFAEARAQGKAMVMELETEARGLKRSLGQWNTEVRKLVKQAGAGSDSPTISRLADLQEQIRNAERRTTEINDQIITLGAATVDEHEIALALSAFHPVWDSLAPREQTRIVELLVERVDYDGAAEKVTITFQPSGIKILAGEMANVPKEKFA